MKGWVGGLVVGVVLGSALAGAAQATILGWEDASNILTRSRTLRLGYVEGVSDALTAVVTNLDSFGKAKTACLDVHERKTVGEFLRWADGIWQSNVAGYGHDNAASL